MEDERTRPKLLLAVLRLAAQEVCFCRVLAWQKPKGHGLIVGLVWFKPEVHIPVIDRRVLVLAQIVDLL
jgi:hypothetical protein